MYCSQCGKEISDESKFCTYCGKECQNNKGETEKSDTASTSDEIEVIDIESQEGENDISQNDNLGKEIDAPEITGETGKETLRDVLFDTFPDLVGELPIKGSWGYGRESAIVIDKKDSIVDQSLPFAGTEIEYSVVKYRAFLELIVARESDEEYCDVQSRVIKQELVRFDDKKFDVLSCEITALSPQHCDEWNKIVGETEIMMKFDARGKSENELEEFSMNEDLLRQKNIELRTRSDVDRIWYHTKIWFDITSFYGQDIVMPGSGQDFTSNESKIDSSIEDSDEGVESFINYIKNLEEINDTTPEAFGREEYAAGMLAKIIFYQSKTLLIEEFYKIEDLKLELVEFNAEKLETFNREMLIISMFLITWISDDNKIPNNVLDTMTFRVFKYMVIEGEIIDNEELLVFQDLVQKRYADFYAAVKKDNENKTFLLDFSHAILKNIFDKKEYSFMEIKLSTIFPAYLETMSGVVKEVKTDCFDDME